MRCTWAAMERGACTGLAAVRSESNSDLAPPVLRRGKRPTGVGPHGNTSVISINRRGTPSALIDKLRSG